MAVSTYWDTHQYKLTQEEFHILQEYWSTIPTGSTVYVKGTPYVLTKKAARAIGGIFWQMGTDRLLPNMCEDCTYEVLDWKDRDKHTMAEYIVKGLMHEYGESGLINIKPSSIEKIIDMHILWTEQ